MKKNSKWLYLYAKANDPQPFFFENGKYKIHLTGVPNEQLWRDYLLFSIAKELWFNDFKEQFKAVIAQAALLDIAVLTLYNKDDTTNN